MSNFDQDDIITTDWVVVKSVKDCEYTSNENNPSDNELDGISIVSECSQHPDSVSLVDSCAEDSVQNENEITKVQTQEIIETATSASNNKSKWTLVSSKSVLNEDDVKKEFYLNCLQEPIQELSENDLGSLVSDTDSDSVSVISYIGSASEDEKKTNIDEQKVDNVSKLFRGLKDNSLYNISNYALLFGTVVLATTSIFLGYYFMENNILDEEFLPSDELNSELNEKIENIKLINLYYSDRNEHSTLVRYHAKKYLSEMQIQQNVDIVKDKKQKKNKKRLKVLENHTNRKVSEENGENESNGKKLLNETSEAKILTKNDYQNSSEVFSEKEADLKIKELYLNKKEEFLIKKEYELLLAEKKIKETLENNKKHNQKFYGDGMDKNLNYKNKKYKNRDTSEKINKKHDSFTKENSNANSYYENQNDNIRKQNEDYASKDFKIYGNKIYKSKYVKDIYDSKQYKKKCKHCHKTGRQLDGENENIWKHENKNKHKNKYERKCDVKGNPKNEENDINDESVGFKRCRKHDKRNTTLKLNNILYNKENYRLNMQNKTLGGNWYSEWHKGRKEIRKKEHASDWLFDRANARDRKYINKHWYFQWMKGRISGRNYFKYVI